MKMKGVLSIPDGLLCEEEVLGKRFHAIASEITFDIVFPSISRDTKSNTMDYLGLSNPLIPPVNGKSLRRGDEKVFWGYPVQYPKMNSYVENVLVEIECTEENANQLAQDLYNVISNWMSAFKRYSQLLTKEQFKRNQNESNNNHILELLLSGKFIQNLHPLTFDLNFFTNCTFLSSKEVEEVIAYASSGKELLLEYQMLLSAYEAFGKGQNRQATIDACAAVEICLVNWIDNFCANKAIPSELLTKKYRSLGDLFKLVRRLDNSFPQLDFEKQIVIPRNDVAHNRNVFPSDESTVQLIEMVEKFLSHYHTRYY